MLNKWSTVTVQWKEIWMSQERRKTEGVLGIWGSSFLFLLALQWLIGSYLTSPNRILDWRHMTSSYRGPLPYAENLNEGNTNLLYNAQNSQWSKISPKLRAKRVKFRSLKVIFGTKIQIFERLVKIAYLT